MVIPSSQRLSALPTAVGTISRLAYARCAAAGLETNPLLRKAGLTRAQIDNPDVRITVQSQIKFLDLVAKAPGDKWLGFHLAQAVADAPIEAAQRTDELFNGGDLDGAAVWKHILHAVEELQRVSPKVGERVN